MLKTLDVSTAMSCDVTPVNDAPIDPETLQISADIIHTRPFSVTTGSCYAQPVHSTLERVSSALLVAFSYIHKRCRCPFRVRTLRKAFSCFSSGEGKLRSAIFVYLYERQDLKAKRQEKQFYTFGVRTRFPTERCRRSQATTPILHPLLYLNISVAVRAFLLRLELQARSSTCLAPSREVLCAKVPSVVSHLYQLDCDVLT